MIWVVDVYGSNSRYWDYELIPGDVRIWQEFEQAAYSEYHTLVVI